jgi:hypothetical protein
VKAELKKRCKGMGVLLFLLNAARLKSNLEDGSRDFLAEKMRMV